MNSDLGYEAPENLQEALQILEQHPDCRILAGGTDLLVEYHQAREKMGRILDISRVAGLKKMEVGSQQVSLGAMITHEELYRSPTLKEVAPCLSQAAGTVGAPQIRHQGTLGGNLAHASPAADLAPPLIALEARVNLIGPGGSRQLSLEDFFTGPGSTRKKAGEIIASVEFPRPPAGARGTYLKIGQRRALAIAVASLAVVINCEGDRLKKIRLAVGSVAPIPLRLRQTEEILEESYREQLPLEEAVEKLQQEISPIDDIRGTGEYRSLVLGNLLRRGLREILEHKGVKKDG